LNTNNRLRNTQQILYAIVLETKLFTSFCVQNAYVTKLGIYGVTFSVIIT